MLAIPRPIILASLDLSNHNLGREINSPIKSKLSHKVEYVSHNIDVPGKYARLFMDMLSDVYSEIMLFNFNPDEWRRREDKHVFGSANIPFAEPGEAEI